MHIKKSLTLSVLTIIGESNRTSIVESIKNTPYSNESTFGFSDIMYDKYYLESTLTKRSTVSIKSINEDGDREDKTIFIYSFTSFVIDFKHNLLEVHGATKDFDKVTRSLNQVLKGKVTISTCYTYPFDLILKLDKLNYHLDVSSLVINKFRYNEHVIGRFIPSISDKEVALSLLKEYQQDIVKCTLDVTLSNEEKYHLEFNNLGRFTIKCTEEYFNEILLLIKKSTKHK